MFRNYLKIALRNLKKNRGYSFINVSGLAIGIACCTLIAVWVQHERSFDRFHKKAESIYRIAELYMEDDKVVEESASLPFPVGPTIAEAFPGVKTVRFYQAFQKIPLLSYEDMRFYEERLFFTDSTVFDIFSFELLQGDPETALSQPFAIVLTESMAKKYFGDEDPLGKRLSLENKLDYTVTGVVADVPSNSHFQFDFLASLQNIGAIFDATGTTFSWKGWYWNPCHTYMLLPPEYAREEFELLLPDFIQTHAPERMRPHLSLFLQPLTDIHLASNLYQELGVNGSERTVAIFSVIAILILLIACVNFMNLTTARSARRAKEVAIRKVAGAYRRQLIAQFLGESLIMSFSAAILGAILVQVVLPVFVSISGAQFGADIIPYPLVLAGIGGLALVVGLMAGFYPAFFLSSFAPAKALKTRGLGRPDSSSGMLRKTMVVFQFCISIALLVGTAVVFQQHRYLQQRDLGFDKEHIVMIPIRGSSIKGQTEAFKAEILQTSGVINAAAISNVLGRDVQICPFGAEGKTEPLQMSGLFVDHDFVATFGVNVQSGRAFSREFSTDSSAFLLNEAAVSLTQWEEPIGKQMSFGDTGSVIGLVSDFNFAPLHQRIRPIAIAIRPSWYSYVAVRVAGSTLSETLKRLEGAWLKFEPKRPFESFFLDDNLNQMYKSEGRLGSVFSAFALLAVIIACLGLFGLASFAAEQRTKEIGIRKTLGATVSSIVMLLSSEFTLLVLVALLIASPLTFAATKSWLQGFAYQTEVGVGLYLATGLLALVIAWLTVGYQAIKAALVNPVDSLKCE